MVTTENLIREHLHYFPDSQMGYTRVRKGKGFAYYFNHTLIQNRKQIDRFKALAIPPAWKDVWICPEEMGHLQATGTDVKGRKQYIYHPEWTRIQQENKFSRIIDFGKAIPLIRKRIKQDIRKRKFTKNKVIALALEIMEETLIRVGNKYYRDQYDSYGLTTLKHKHVKVSNIGVSLKFKGKKGIIHEINIKNPKLSRLLKNVKEIPGQHLFQFIDENGKASSIDSGDLNHYIRECTNQDFTSKDFRTWYGTVWSFRKLCEMEPFKSKQECRTNINNMFDFVASKLGNTRSICKKYYVADSLIRAYENKTAFPFFKKALRKSGKSSDLQKAERQVLKLLEYATNETLKA